MLIKVGVTVSIIVGLFAVFLVLPIFSPFYDFLRDHFLQKQHTKETTGILLTKESLAKYAGGKGSPGLYVAVLGKVFDVSAGERHYGPEGSYHFFAGKDGSRGYVSGNSGEGELDDNVADFTAEQMLQLVNWVSFYEKKEEYKYIGKVIGAFYDSDGHATKQLSVVIRQASAAQNKQDDSDVRKRQFPPCNAMWNEEDGSVVWCTTESGGIERDWAGLPRLYFEPGATEPRCACVRDKGPPTGKWESQIDRGDLDNPSVKTYEGCDTRSPLCKVQES